MSENITFFVRSAENLVPIGTFGRSSMVSQAIRTVFNVNNVYGTARVMTPQEIEKALCFLHDKVAYWHNEIADTEREIIAVGDFNNTVKEKLEAIFDLRGEIAEMQEHLEDTELAVKWYSMLQLMRESTDEPIKFYCGIEVDEDLTVENLSN